MISAFFFGLAAGQIRKLELKDAKDSHEKIIIDKVLHRVYHVTKCITPSEVWNAYNMVGRLRPIVSIMCMNRK